MRIAIVRKKFSVSGAGGAERYASAVASELVRRGHIVTVFAEEFKGEVSKELRWVKVPSQMALSFCPSMTFHKVFQATIKRSDFDVLYSLCRTYPCDVVRITEQLHSIWLPMAYSPLAKYNPRHKGILKLERKVFSPLNTGWVVTNSNLTREQVFKEYGFPQERIMTIRNGVDRKLFYPAHGTERHSLRERHKIPPDALALLFVAENFKIKGLEYAIRALAALPQAIKDKALLLIAGGDSPANYQRLARKLGVERSLHFLGERRGMRELYSAADLLLYPSLYEPFANVCLEACACALPVLTTAMNGASEIVAHGRSGYVVGKASDIDGVSRHIAEFAAMSPHDRTLMGQAALDSTLTFTWERHVDDLEGVLEKAASIHKR